MYDFTHSIFYLPTSSYVANACRFSEEYEIIPESIILKLLTPERARDAITCEPTPPTPNTIM
jgi:hypothetical protein